MSGLVCTKSKTVILFLCLLSLLAVGQYITANWFHALNIAIPAAKAQMIFFIPVVLVLVSLVNLFVALPRRWVLPLMIIGLVVTGFTFSSYSIRRAVVFFSPLSADSSGAKTRIYRKQFSKELLQAADIPVSALNETVDSHQEAVGIIDNRPHIKAVVWGSTKVLRVTFGSSVVSTLLSQNKHDVRSSELDERTLGLIQNLKLITQIPELDIPFWPAVETLSVLAASFSEDESRLASGGSLVARWRSPAIREFVFYRLGTFQLIRAFEESPSLDNAMLEKAIASLQTALKFSTIKSNIFLERAILNNYAVATMALAALNKNEGKVKDARIYLLQAARVSKEALKKHPRMADSVAVQRHNSDVLRVYLRSS